MMEDGFIRGAIWAYSVVMGQRTDRDSRDGRGRWGNIQQPTVLADGHHAQQPMTEVEASRQEGSCCEGGSKCRRAGSAGSTAGRMPAATVPR